MDGASGSCAWAAAPNALPSPSVCDRLRRITGLGAVLLTAPDEVRLRQVRRLVRGAPAITFLALEADAVRSGADARIWRVPSGSARLSLRELSGYVVAHGRWSEERPLTRLTLPRPIRLPDQRRTRRTWLLPARLGASEKRVLDAIGDWPWIRPAHLRPLLGVGARRLAQLLQRLTELDLVRAVMISGRRRLVLTDAGIACLARRDRTAVGDARKRWSVRRGVPVEPGSALGWRKVPGLRARQLLRNLDHTEAVHGWGAGLAEQAAARSQQLVQFEPPHRASRYFRHQGSPRSIHPDAFGVLRSEGEHWSFFLEWERRAVRPATMRARLAALPALLRHGTAGRGSRCSARPARSSSRMNWPAGHFLATGGGGDGAGRSQGAAARLGPARARTIGRAGFRLAGNRALGAAA